MTDTTLYCSFCGKSQHEVAKLIAGPTAHICDECTKLAWDLVEEMRVEAAIRRVFADELKSLSLIPNLAAKIGDVKAEIANPTHPGEEQM